MLALRIIRVNGWWEDFWTEQAAFRQGCIALHVNGTKSSS